MTMRRIFYLLKIILVINILSHITLATAIRTNVSNLCSIFSNQKLFILIIDVFKYGIL